MITKAEILSINATGTRCVVRMPLFETAASAERVTAKALVNITPGIFNNLVVGDIVFIAFEENALEKPIIIGKLFTGAHNENKVPGGACIVDSLRVRTSGIIPSSTLFEFPETIRKDYTDLETPKKMADYIKWLENFVKKLIAQLDEHFRCFKNWVQWQLRPENVEIDDGDLDTKSSISEPFLYQNEGSACKICGKNCSKKETRSYSKVDSDKVYPNT